MTEWYFVASLMVAKFEQLNVKTLVNVVMSRYFVDRQSRDVLKSGKDTFYQ